MDRVDPRSSWRIVERLLDAVASLAPERGTAVLIVEQHVQRVLQIAQRGVGMVHGHVAFAAPAAELSANRDVVEASYLGEAALAGAADSAP